MIGVVAVVIKVAVGKRDEIEEKILLPSAVAADVVVTKLGNRQVTTLIKTIKLAKLLFKVSL